MTPWVRRLLFANVVMWLLTQAERPLYIQLLLYPPDLLDRPWMLVTYMFLHDLNGMSHILFNMLALYFFGSRVEMRIGSTHFIRLYLFSGLTGGLASLIFAAKAATVGASAAVFGVMLAFAWFWPRERVYIWGILPIEARWLVILTTIGSLYFGINPGGGNVAHFAHLGGYAGGALYLGVLHRRLAASRRAWQTKVTAPVGTVDVKRIPTIDLSRVHPVNREEVERLIAKIQTSGFESLTNSERTFLAHFTARES